MTIELRDLSKTYHSQSTFPVKAVQAVNLMIEQGEFVAIMGPSGSGKTTLLNLISGIDTATSGEVVIDDVAMSQLSEKQRIEFRRDHIGFIFQDYSLLPVLTATENVEFILLLQGKSAQECRARANELLEQVGLSELKDRYPTMMSGGQ